MSQKPLTQRIDFVYFYDVTNGNPNGDPDAGNMPRMDPDTHVGLQTDVSLKRKVRNLVALEHGDAPGHAIYVKEKAIQNHQNRKAYEALGIKPEPKKLPKDPKQAQGLIDWMCSNFYDVRAFGAVMTTETNTGQVRGPVQFSFAQSVDPIFPMEVTITRMAITTEADAEKQGGDNRTMGRKYIVPYGLYRMHGFISAHFAQRTGFSENDLQLLWSALINMFDHDRSSAHGEMSARKLIAFRHQSALGNAPAHQLFDAVTVTRMGDSLESPPRRFTDYRIAVDAASIPKGIAVQEWL